MKLFVGLGNPGEKYSKHRHNIGFRAIDRIAESYHFGPWKKKFKGLLTEGVIGDEKIILLKPQTYMNESGQSVGEAARFYNLAEDDIVIFHDELDLPSGKVKVKIGGGNAGHNGLRSISAHIGNQTVRVRLGISHPGSKEAVAHYVLTDFPKSDLEWVENLLEAVARCATQLSVHDIQGFMNKVSLLLQPLAASPKEAAKHKVTKEMKEELSSEQLQKGKSLLNGPLSQWLRGKKPTR